MSASVRRDVVILACAISAGIHGALAPQHFAEGAGTGGGFVLATVLLAALAVALTGGPESNFAVAAAVLAFAGLLASYAFATTTGLPLLHPEPEPVDAVALVTKAVEAVGLLTASGLLCGRPSVAVHPPASERNADMSTTRAARPIPLHLTALVAFFSALAALAVSNGHDALATATPHIRREHRCTSCAPQQSWRARRLSCARTCARSLPTSSAPPRAATLPSSRTRRPAGRRTPTTSPEP